MSLARVGRTLALAAGISSALALATSAATAAVPSVSGAFTPIPGAVGHFRVKPLKLTTDVTIAQADGQNGVLRRLELRLPSNFHFNTRDFPACTVARVNSPASFDACPLGSAVGRGDVIVDVPAAGLTDVAGKIVAFNGGRSNTFAFNIYTATPVVVNTAFPAKLRRTRGRYGYTLTANLPSALQQIGEAGWPYQIKRIRFGFDGLWRGRPYTEVRSCPKSGRTAIAGSFQFAGTAVAPTETVGTVSCRPAK
ncbi:hypothetical protein [Conexibacter sp. CPCC 206217]|uniref:hypothetical protein n=1 Tax=Conexibacter sp. CPCC 206217 TaxID=3064574 RepID=UPI00271A6E41|nr:hypothetical protein [Conexibacter sp. CPCC 206217]MDO8209265.1 hypothetical protein [Conexibacter sp. CPCC 206217]